MPMFPPLSCLLRRWIPPIAALAVVIAVARPCRGAFRFDAAFESLPSVASVNHVVAADIDGDGVTDLVVGGAGETLQWHHGLPTGGFAPVGPLLAVPGGVSSFALGDIDGDGRLDLVVADGAKNAWSVLGNGDGTFRPRQLFLSLFTCGAIALADLDRDGRLDLVAMDAFAPLYTMRGLGDGGFQLASIVGILGLPASMVVGDFDADGLPDVLVGYDFYQGTTHTQAVHFLRGQAGLALAAPVVCASGFTPARMRAGDVDEDGVTDAMIMKGSALAVLFGARGAVPSTIVDVAVGSPTDAVLADLDGDGHAELALSARAEPLDAVAIFRRAGRAFARVADFAAGASPYDLAFVDVDRDGRLDAVVDNPPTSSLAVVRARGVLSFGGDLEVAAGPKTWDLAPGDFDGDGTPDVVVAEGGSSAFRLALHRGVGDGSFFAPALSPVQDYVSVRLEVGDVNGDGRLDVAAAADYVPTVRGFLGDGVGHFTPGTRWSLYFPGTPTYRVDAAVADFDEDGKDDAVFATDPGLYLLRGDATDGLGAPVKLATQMKCVIAVDLNRDGHVDLVSTNSKKYGEWGSPVNVLLGRGDGTFAALPTFYAGYKPYALAASDLTGDGVPDLVVANWGDKNVAVFRGAGDGTFTGTFTIAGLAPNAIALADCDGDGRQDLLAAVPEYSGIAIRPGLGDGTFGTPEVFGCRNTPDVLRCHDLDRNGMPDLIVGHSSGNEFDVLMNRADVTTPTLVSVIEARAEGGRVHIEWASGWSALEAARVQRVVGGSWQDVGRVTRDGSSRLVFEESVPDGEYDYRLAVEDGGRLVTLGDAHVVVRAARPLGIVSCAWDARGTALRVELSIPGTGAARIAVLDLMGRVIARGEVTPTGAPTQGITLASEQRVPSGICWVRLEHAGRAVSRKAILLR